MKKCRLQAMLHAVLRPAFAALLAVSQFTSRRGALLTPGILVPSLGVLTTLAGVWLIAAATRHLTRAVAATTLATTGPYRTIRHPIYTGMYLICIGLGLVFFAWLWFVVLLIFIPLWGLEAHHEEEAIATMYGETYSIYKSRTAMFVPWAW